MRTFNAFNAARHALKSVVNYWPVAARIALPWMIVVAVIEIMISLANQQSTTVPSLLIQYVALAAILVVISSISVSWHRFILLDEAPPGNISFRLDSIVWRYFGRLLLVGLTVTAVILLPLFVLLFAFPPEIAVIVILIPALALSLAFSMTLPAVATAAPPVKLIEVFAKIRGNELNILLYAFLIAIIMLGLALAITILAALLSVLPEGLANVILPIAAIPLNLLSTVFSISAITTLYGFFCESRDI